MIATKIIPSFHVIELSGQCVESFFLGDFGVEKIVAASSYYTTDIEAFQAVLDSVNDLSLAIDTPIIFETIELNPEFFPSVPELPGDGIEAHISDFALLEHFDEGNVPILYTKKFDPLGDHVQMRITSEPMGSFCNLKIKVACDPTVYLTHKMLQEVERAGTIDSTKKKPYIH